MIRMLKNIICLLLTLILFLSISSSVILAVDASNISDTKGEIVISDLHTKDITTKSGACLLMDAKSGKILYAKNAEEKLYPASTTKLMTAILTLENCKLTDTATVSHNSIYSIPVRIFSC